MQSDSELFGRFAEDAFRSGRPDLAGEFLRRLSVKPSAAQADAEQLVRDALQLQSQQKLREAEPLLLEAIRLKPDVPTWHDNLAVNLARQGRLLEAIATFRVSLRLDPTPGSVWNNLGIACLEAKNFVAAEAALREAVPRLKHDLAPRLSLAQSLRGQLKLEDAEQIDRETIALFPQEAPAHTSLALTLNAAKKPEVALEFFRNAARLAPNIPEAQSNLAAALGKMKLYEECIVVARRAIQLNPNHAGAWSNLGNCLRDLGRFDEAEPALRESIRLNPHDADAVGNLALTLANAGRFADAIPVYDRALELKPQTQEVRFNRALAHLTLGDYARGWPDYEARWHTEQFHGGERTYPMPKWDGTSLRGKTIFLHTEQGIGDTLQFIRFAAPLAEQGATVMIHPTPDLVPVLKSVPGIARVIDAPRAEVTFDCHCPLLSVPYMLQTRLESIPATVPYMAAPPEAVARWSEKLSATRGFKIGIVWQGNPKFPGDRWRSVPLKFFAPIAAVPGVEICSLQKGEPRKQIAECGFAVRDLGAETQSDLGDVAGLMINLDLIISTCTSMVHLAGALARPTWVILSANPDWRWLRDRTDSPWYPTVRLFRQEKLGEWPAVFQSIAQELQEQITTKR